MSPSLRFVLPLLMLAGGTGHCLADIARPEADFNAIDSAIRTYKINARDLPPPELGLKALVERPDSLPPEKRWVKLLTEIPTDPWGNPYRYLAGEGLKDGFGLYSCGPDGISSSAGNDPDDRNSWSDKSPAGPSWQERWKLYALLGAAILAAGSFLLGYRVAMKEARRGS